MFNTKKLMHCTLLKLLIPLFFLLVSNAIQAAAISGTVWDDVNYDKVFDGTETGISGVTIVLYDENTRTCSSDSTDGNGDYSFNVGNGKYQIYEAFGETTPAPVVCPPTESKADNNTHTVIQGTIADPTDPALNGYASSTPNRIIDITVSGSDITHQNFGDFSSTPYTTCPSDAFLIQKSSSDLYGVNLVTGHDFILEDTWGVTTNGVGFNMLDNNLYGYMNIDQNGVKNGEKISLINSNYEIFGLKVPGLNNVGAYVGDVSTDGYLYLNKAKNVAWVVDVNFQRSTYLSIIQTLNLSAHTGIADWAFNAVNDMLYGVNKHGFLIQIDPSTGQVTNLGHTGISEGGAFGAVYFDVDGYFYASNNGTGKIYRIDLRDENNLEPTATLFTAGPSSSTNDGARCVFAEVGQLDFGDAPDTYATTLNQNGARHIRHDDLKLGALWDKEDDGLPTNAADGDDIDNLDDEDGLNGGFPALVNGANTYSVDIDIINTTGTDAYLYGYIDWNNDGDFEDIDEKSGQVVVDADNTYAVQWNVPSRPTSLATYARFRLSTDDAASGQPKGPAIDGEVEDYPVSSLYTGNTLTIVKSAAPDDGTAFDFQQDIDTTGNFSLSNGDSKVFNDLASGTYIISEDLPYGWQVSLICNGSAVINNTTATISLSQGENVTCTYNNFQHSKLTIIKNTQGGEGTFNFNTSNLPGGNFSLATNGYTAEKEYTNLTADTYDLRETVPAGWDLLNSSCDNGKLLPNIVLNEGDDVTCTFINAKRGSIQIKKNTSPSGGSNFGFTDDIAPPNNFSLNDAGTQTFSNIPPGTYTVTENAPGGGFELTGLSCSDNNSTINASTRTATINLEAGELVVCTFTNTENDTVTIEKVTRPVNAAGSFSFTQSLDKKGKFLLSGGQYKQFNNVTPNVKHSVSEADPDSNNFDLTAIDCYDTSTNQHFSGDVSTRTVDFNMAPGEKIHCSFINTQRGQIIIDKVTDPANEPQQFSFHLTGGPESIDQSFSLADSTAPHNSSYQKPGIYSVIEASPSHWEQSSVTCSDGSQPENIQLDPGEIVTCTFYNNKKGQILVDKITLPANDPQPFNFNLNGGPDNVAQKFSLTDSASAYDSGDLTAGSYNLVELSTSEWNLSSATCSDGSDPANISLSTGEIIRCTFSNTENGHIIIDKVTIPSSSLQSFDFQLTGGPDTISQSFNLTNTATPYNSGSIKPGTYTLAEILPDGWQQDSISCDNGGNSASIQLAAGETVTCTITNHKNAEIIVRKEAHGDAISFEFTLTGGPQGINQSFSLADGESNSSTNLQPGAGYSLSEVVPDGWFSNPVTCDDGSDANNISLSAGELVTCTFINIQGDSFAVAKITIPAGGAGFDFIDNIEAPNSFSLNDGNIGIFTNIQSGQNYTVTEDDASYLGYRLVDIVCQGDFTSLTTDIATSTVSFTQGADQTGVCVFVNQEQARIIVDKVTDPTGDPQSFDFSLSGGPDNIGQNFALADTDTPYHSGDLKPGSSYFITETTISGWDLSSAVCDDGSDPANITLSAGQTVTCTFTNSKPGIIIVDKQTNPANDPQSFDFTLHGGPDNIDQSFSLTDSSSAYTSAPLKPGTYDLHEHLLSEWHLSSINCDDGSSADNIVLNGGETITCNVINTFDPPIAPVVLANLTIIKNTTAGQGSFNFYSIALPGGNFLINTTNNTGQVIYTNLLADNYDIVEQVGSDWELINSSCDNGKTLPIVVLNDGDNVTCTFVNTKKSMEIPVNSKWSLVLLICLLVYSVFIFNLKWVKKY